MLSALIKGTESFCCEECLETVIAGGVKVQFQVWESPNGTNEQRVSTERDLLSNLLIGSVPNWLPGDACRHHSIV